MVLDNVTCAARARAKIHDRPMGSHAVYAAVDNSRVLPNLSTNIDNARSQMVPVNSKGR